MISDEGKGNKHVGEQAYGSPDHRGIETTGSRTQGGGRGAGGGGKQRTMVQTLMGEMTGEYFVGTNQYADDESGRTNQIGAPGGAEITDSTLDLEAAVMAETMLNLGHIGNAGAYGGLPRGRAMTNQAMGSAAGSALCTMLARATTAVDFAINDQTRIGTTQWRTVLQGSTVRELNSQGTGTRIGGTDFW